MLRRGRLAGFESWSLRLEGLISLIDREMHSGAPKKEAVEMEVVLTEDNKCDVEDVGTQIKVWLR